MEEKKTTFLVFCGNEPLARGGGIKFFHFYSQELFLIRNSTKTQAKNKKRRFEGKKKQTNSRNK